MTAHMRLIAAAIFLTSLSTAPLEAQSRARGRQLDRTAARAVPRGSAQSGQAVVRRSRAPFVRVMPPTVHVAPNRYGYRPFISGGLGLNLYYGDRSPHWGP